MEETVGESFRRLLQQQRPQLQLEALPRVPGAIPWNFRFYTYDDDSDIEEDEEYTPTQRPSYVRRGFRKRPSTPKPDIILPRRPLPEETHTTFNPWKTKSKTEAIPDWNTKALQKRHQRPYFSPVHHSWEIDIVHIHNPANGNILRLYLFCININSKYLVVIPIKDKSSNEIRRALSELLR